MEENDYDYIEREREKTHKKKSLYQTKRIPHVSLSFQLQVL
jgi:hypothetical protein